jgi:signal transduction histidine kinase
MSLHRDPSATLRGLFGRFPKPANDLQADIYREQHIVITRQMLAMGMINVIASLLIAGAMYPIFGATPAILWASPLVLCGLFQMWSWRKFRGSKVPEHISGSFLRKSEWVALLAGVLWGSATFVFHGRNGSEHIVFLHLVQAGMAGGVISLITPLPRHTMRFSLTCIAPVVPSALMYEGNYLLPVATLGLLFIAALINSSIDSYKQLKGTVTKTWESREARNNLVDAIESTSDAFALYDAQGELVLANKQHKELFGDDHLTLNDGSEGKGIETVKHAGHWLMQSHHKTRLGGNVVVHTDVTALKMRERELVEARKEAEAADAAKSRFLSTMSHELRTPLNIILGFSRLMASDSQVKLTWDEVAEYADSINESGAHLLQLIDDIIDYSKVGLDKLLLTPSDVDIRAMLARSISLAASFEDVRDLSKVDVMVGGNLGLLRVDESICQRIIMNLITNAMRFGGNDTRIVIRAGLNGDGCPFIAVRDFGNGIPQNDLERVFEAFYQRDSGLDRGYGGTGLGLTLCRHLARLHDGDVILKSRVGVGTTAMFVLPKSTHIQRTVDTVEHAEAAKVA